MFENSFNIFRSSTKFARVTNFLRHSSRSKELEDSKFFFHGNVAKLSARSSRLEFAKNPLLPRPYSSRAIVTYRWATSFVTIAVHKNIPVVVGFFLCFLSSFLLTRGWSRWTGSHFYGIDGCSVFNILEFILSHKRVYAFLTKNGRRHRIFSL